MEQPMPDALPDAVPATVPIRPQPNPADFRVSASDAQGHGVHTQFRIQPGMDRQMAEIVGSKYFDYRTPADLLRHALKVHLEWLVSISPVRSFIQQIDAINAIVTEDEYQVEFLRSVDKLAALVLDHQRGGRDEQAVAIIRRVRDQIETMPEDSVYRGLFLKEIETRWGAWLRTSTGSFGVMEEGEDNA